MEQELKEVAKHIRRIGLGALAHANWHGHYFSEKNECWSELSIIQASHAVELLIKARIAEENPLLIFDKLPKLRNAEGNRLSFSDLVDHGRTVQYFDLPDRLWATTGIEIPALETFIKVGKVRNSIQHFAPPEENISFWTSRLIYEVIDPFINLCWDLHAIDFNEDDEPYIYLIPCVLKRGIKFLVSSESVEDLENMDIDWPLDSDFINEMKNRIHIAKSDNISV